ncbi:glycoside hydrolase family 18 protein [Amniculicola lignicola CBS 123094]|uniref:chitinase n=1 Tax=Amniculicola lignicola CBS 123094 TaxID=1392246 RepID=A0A6A5WIX4_9PLEO|nr:glycoside hydrolase family 18 protein [Amniculicola lignicola CBS 123094]
MHSFTFAAATIAVSFLTSTVSAAFSAGSSKNVVVYWGQGYDQITLTEVCNDPSVDVVSIGFVNGFPKNTQDYPSTNFANACGPGYYTKPDGTVSGLLSNCAGIGPGIKTCQANGKKVLLSIGGGAPTDYYLPSVAVAQYFAKFLWGAFGPQTSAWVDAGKPRPFGDAVVDGFDLDIESFMSPAPNANYQYAYYDAFVNYLRATAFPTGPSTYYISAAPQCIVPDAHLATAIQNSKFDFIFVQFYNTPQCSARAGYNGLSNPSASPFTFKAWVDWLKTNSANPSVKLYIGLPAGPDGAPSDHPAYLTPTEAKDLINYYAATYPTIFGGVMLWEATVSVRNEICGKAYGTYIKDILNGKAISTACPTTTSSVVSSTTSTNIATPTGVSPDGSCGPTNGNTCKGYAGGECCSIWGYW